MEELKAIVISKNWFPEELSKLSAFGGEQTVGDDTYGLMHLIHNSFRCYDCSDLSKALDYFRDNKDISLVFMDHEGVDENNEHIDVFQAALRFRMRGYEGALVARIRYDPVHALTKSALEIHAYDPWRENDINNMSLEPYLILIATGKKPHI